MFNSDFQCVVFHFLRIRFNSQSFQNYLCDSTSFHRSNVSEGKARYNNRHRCFERLSKDFALFKKKKKEKKKKGSSTRVASTLIDGDAFILVGTIFLSFIWRQISVYTAVALIRARSPRNLFVLPIRRCSKGLACRDWQSRRYQEPSDETNRGDEQTRRKRRRTAAKEREWPALLADCAQKRT